MCGQLVFTFVLYSCQLLGRGPKDYFCKDKWNYVDLLLLVASFVDVTLFLMTANDVITIRTRSTQALKFVRTIRVLRAFRLLRVRRKYQMTDGFTQFE